MNCTALGKIGHQPVVIVTKDENRFVITLETDGGASVTFVFIELTVVAGNCASRTTHSAVGLVPAVRGVPHTFNDDFPLFGGR